MIEFRVTGHGGFDVEGSDIVCAAVSILVYNTVNSCERFAGVVLDVKDKRDLFTCKIPASLPDRALVLLESLVFGIEQLEEQYPEYVQIQHH